MKRKTTSLAVVKEWQVAARRLYSILTLTSWIRDQLLEKHTPVPFFGAKRSPAETDSTPTTPKTTCSKNKRDDREKGENLWECATFIEWHTRVENFANLPPLWNERQWLILACRWPNFVSRPIRRFIGKYDMSFVLNRSSFFMDCNIVPDWFGEIGEKGDA